MHLGVWGVWLQEGVLQNTFIIFQSVKLLFFKSFFLLKIVFITNNVLVIVILVKLINWKKLGKKIKIMLLNKYIKKNIVNASFFFFQLLYWRNRSNEFTA